jgi:hypothetical protein
MLYAVILGVFLYAVQERVSALREDINQAIYTQCIASQPQELAIFARYNDVVHSLIVHERQSEKKDLRTHRAEQATNDARLEAELKADLIPITQPNCNKQFLR